MSVYKEHLKLQSHGGTPSYINVTQQVRAAIENSGIKEGICVVISPHTTCGVFFEEFVHDVTPEGDEFLQADLNDALGKIIPDHTDAPGQFRYPGPEHFAAVRSWPNAAAYLPNDDISDLYNGDARLKATVIGSSQTFEVTNGKLRRRHDGVCLLCRFRPHASPREKVLRRCDRRIISLRI